MMKRFSLKQLVLPLTASLITACGSGSEEKKDSNQPPNSDPKSNTSLTIDSTNAVYFASKDEDGTWHEMEQGKHEMDNGYLHIVYICPGTWGHNVIAEESVYEKDGDYNYQLCHEQNLYQSIQTNNISDGVNLKHARNYIQAYSGNDSFDYLALGFDETESQAYAYKRTINLEDFDPAIPLEVDFRDTTYSQKTTHKCMPYPHSFGYSATHVTQEYRLTLNFEHYTDDCNGDIIFELPESWETNDSKYIEERLTTGDSWLPGTHKKVGKRPSYSTNSYTLDTPIFDVNDLDIDVNTRIAQIDAPTYSPEGFVGAFYELKYIGSYTNFYFYADDNKGKVRFDLVDFTSLPNFPNDRITEYPYLEPDFDKLNFQLRAEYVNEWWLEYESIGRESLSIEASNVKETVIVEEAI